MAPGNNERHPNHTGTIPKTKVRNNCNVPQEAVTPTRRDMTTNLVSTSLDWVPVSEYNSRANYNQSRKQSNNTHNSSDQELTDLDNAVSFESGFGRFVPVRPQPRVLPLNVQNRDNLADQHDDGASSLSGHTLHPYAHQMQNGINPHSNHAAAAVMIVNPTTPNAVAVNMSQPFNAPNQNRNNLTRNLNPARNNFDINTGNNNSTLPSNSRSGTKTVNLMNNMYDQGQGSFSNLHDNSNVHRDSARSLGEAIVAACPDAAAVERRLGQIREYIRVTSSLVDTMRNSEDEAYVEHTKEEYDKLVEMVMKLKESESKLVEMMVEKGPDNVEVPAEEFIESAFPIIVAAPETVDETTATDKDKTCNIKNENTGLRKVSNVENEQINKTLHKSNEDLLHQEILPNPQSPPETSKPSTEHLQKIDEINEGDNSVDIPDPEENKDQYLNELLRKNILSCVEKVALIEDMKTKKKSSSDNEQQDVVVRPVSVQSNGSAYSENELWQNEIKSKMEMSQIRLVALKQQQKRLLKYQEETKQQLEEMSRERQSQEIHPSTSHENYTVQSQQFTNQNYQANRMYPANQVGVATTLPQAAEAIHAHAQIANNMDDHGHPSHSHSQDDRFSRDANVASSEEAVGGGRDSEVDEDEGQIAERSRLLQMKLRELQMKKQHMESLVTEFQKLQMATSHRSSRNTYSSSGEDSGDEEPTPNKSGSIKNKDPFKLMEIKAIKAALQKTKDLMRSVETYESEHVPSNHEDPFHMSSHSNINDNKSEGGGSMGGWSNDGSVCRVRNSLPQRRKLTNEQHSQQQSHETNLAAMQDLAQELRMETERIMSERDRIKHLATNKEASRKQKKVNEEVRPGPSRPSPGPMEHRQMQLRALLADKQRELEALLNKEKVMCTGSEPQKLKADSQTASVVNQSYASEQEEPDSRSEQILLDSQNSRENENFRGGGDSAMGVRSSIPSHIGSTYCSDSDSASRTKSNQRNRPRRRQTLEDDINVLQGNNSNQNVRHELRSEASNVNLVPPISQNIENATAPIPFPHMSPQSWNSSKSNQDMRTNQFTQNSHSQTMERLLGTPQMSYPPSIPASMPFNMMMPFGMMGGCGCGCGLWGAWCWQQLAMQQREIHQLRDQLNHLEERWRAENASHTLNNQVPPGNRANNYWDNFRSYSRQNLLSASSKTNSAAPRNVEPRNIEPRNTESRNESRNEPRNETRNVETRNVEARNVEVRVPESRGAVRRVGSRSLSQSSAPDILPPAPAPPPPARHLHITNPIPELVQSHSNNLNTPVDAKRKSSSKLPAKNSTNRRNCALEYAQTSNINIASAVEAPNPNLASTSRETHDKATSKLFDLLRENVYSEVTALIGVNESHPDFLIQLFRELQMISSDPLRQRVLQSIRNILSQYSSLLESQNMASQLEERSDVVSTTTGDNAPIDYNSPSISNHYNVTHIDNKVVRFLLMKSEDVCTLEFIEALTGHIVGNSESRQQARNKVLEFLSKYEGMRVSDVSGDIIENLPLLSTAGTEGDESTQHTSELSESSILQDVAGSLNLFSSSDTQLHQMNAYSYDMWPHVHMDIDPEMNDSSARSSQEGKVDLLNGSEMANGDLAEADQTCPGEEGGANEAGGGAEALPDVVDTEEATPTEAEAEWLGLDRVPTRLHLEETSEKQKD